MPHCLEDDWDNLRRVLEQDQCLILSEVYLKASDGCLAIIFKGRRFHSYLISGVYVAGSGIMDCITTTLLVFVHTCAECEGNAIFLMY